jgi:putative chitinase
LELRNIKQYQNKQIVEDKLIDLMKKKLELEEKQKSSTARLATVTEGAPGQPAYNDLAKKLSAGGITDKKAQANILAQIKAESGGVAKSENLNYSGSKLFEMYGEGNKAGNKVRFKNKAEAEELAAKGPEAIGNVIYGNRMGNSADEGYKYRGRGLIQLTGKENYEKFGKLIGIDLVQNPDFANDPEIAQRLAVEYFKEKQKQKVDLSDIAQVGKAVGYAGGEDETRKRAKYAQEFLQEGKIPTAATGGMFSGSPNGYPVMLHGNEMVIPMPDTKSLEVKKTELSEVSQEMNNTVTTNTSTSDNTSQIMADLYTMMSEKFDAMIVALEDGNDHTEKLVKFSAV